MNFNSVQKLLTGVLVTGAGATYPAQRNGGGDRTFQGYVAGTGAVTATADIQVSNDGTNWLTLATITLSGTTSDTDGFSSAANWAYYRADCTAISGTDAALTVLMGA